MVSTWTEYLRLNVLDDATALLEICQYEPLAEVQYNDDGEGQDMPDTIDGKEVVGRQDGWFVGGDLSCYNDEDTVQYDKNNLEDALQWLIAKGWHVTNTLTEELRKAVKA